MNEKKECANRKKRASDLCFGVILVTREPSLKCSLGTYDRLTISVLVFKSFSPPFHHQVTNTRAKYGSYSACTGLMVTLLVAFVLVEG